MMRYEFERFVDDLELNNQFSGIIGIYEDKTTLYEKSCGYACYDLNIKNERETRFAIGSLTKQFTACCILQLIESGNIAMDNPISMFIDNFPNGENISIEQLLTQTSGIFDYTEADSFDVEGKLTKTKDELVELIKKLPQTFLPGEKWEYSNSNYILLSYIIEKVSDMSFEDYMEKELLQSHGLMNTTFADRGKIIKNRSFGYQIQENKIRHADYLDLSQPLGAGGLYSTLGDLLIWCKLLIASKVVSREMSQKLLEGQVLIDNMAGYSYGQVIRFAGDNKVKEAGHYGGLSGFMSYMSIYPDSKKVMILLSNLENETNYDVVAKIKESGILF